MISMLRDPAWIDWFHSHHQRRFRETATKFEDYATEVLEVFHPDFVNPDPAGQIGDGGCDGLADFGRLLYACYGTRDRGARHLASKLTSDFERARDSWRHMERWVFLTNAPFGTPALEALTELRRQHCEGTARPLDLSTMNESRFWNEIVSTLELKALDRIFPGCPGTANVELDDLIPLLDAIGTTTPAIEAGVTIRPVPLDKMEYNSLSAPARTELDAGRRLVPRIEDWFADAAEPDLRDQQAEAFRRIYEEQARVTQDPDEILQRVYAAIGGPDFRWNSVRANAVYGVVAFFFDECHIFEEPPQGWTTESVERAFPVRR
ncbi:ABC-three component system protein [Nocardioides sp. Leaf374]|uniref:ABC-three component system protein n=1 Tax=Nocardioides sp. Leaf374 TaxID=2876560 RepID=UPI001E5163D0|nr:ABC-three component system protein [Nocardioides sp. Leaf374]